MNYHWPHNRYMLMLWFPAACVYFLPIIVSIVTGIVYGKGFDFPGHLLHPGTLLTISILGIPFFAISALAQKDYRKIPFRAGMIRWLICLIPCIAVTVYLFFVVTRSSVLLLPGFSTAPVALMFLLPANGVLVALGRAIGVYLAD